MSVKASAAVAFFSLFLCAAPALAHVPAIPDAGSARKDMDDPTVRSAAVYARLGDDAIDVYSFTASKDAEIPIEVLVPFRPSLEAFRPSFALIGPDVQEEDPAAYDGPVGGNDRVMAVAAPEGDRSVFYEPYGMETYYHGTERKARVTAGTRYQIAVFEPEGRAGDYVLAAGSAEDFRGVDFAGLLNVVTRAKLGAVAGRDIPWLDLAGLFLMMAGIVIGLGAVTVIDWHGFLARKSPYWTEATVRAHKVTKPLIWAGTALAAIGGAIVYRKIGLSGTGFFHAALLAVLVLNGCFLTFVVSPFLLKREKEGKAAELLPASLQRKIAASFVVSFIGWWSAAFLFVWHVVLLR